MNLPASPTIALLTDFGHQDAFVGVLKGVILSTFQKAGSLTAPALVDLTHEIPRHDIHCAAWLLSTSYSYFPSGTVFLCVVDPGVGSSRQAGLVLHWKSRDWTFVGPDNGVFTTIIQAAAGEDLEIHSLNNPALYRAGQHGLSQTFHGRDRYAPVAANAALQKMQHRLDLSDFGPLWPNPVLLDWAAPTRANNQAQGSVMHIDVYGNVITNIPNEWLSPYAPGSTVSVSGQRMTANTTATVATAYQEGEKGTLLLVPGSNHTAELAVNHGSARQALNIMVGDALCLTGDAPK